MSFPCRISAVALAVFCVCCAAAQAATFRVCAEPDNLPFSNRAGEGFENRIAAVLARDLGSELILVPIVQGPHRFVRETLGAGRCDALMGMPVGAEGVETTQPYYRSSWVFVARSEQDLPRSFADGLLAGLRIGVTAVGDGPDTPPVVALGRHGLAAQLRLYPAAARQPARIVQDVALNRLDLAVLWGPAAGAAVALQSPALVVVPTPPDDGAGIPMTVSIAVAVRRGNFALRDALDAALARRRTAVSAILAEYHVPVLGG
jgi:mxaJ protein